MAVWKKTPLINNVETSESSTYKSGSTTVGYYGCNSKDEYDANNACALIFDTSDFPSDSILKYKDCELELYVNGVTNHGWSYDSDDTGRKYPESSSYYEARVRSIEYKASTVAKHTYKWMKDNWTARETLHGSTDEWKTGFNHAKFHHKTMVILLTKHNKYSFVYGSRVAQSGTYLRLTYNDVKPKATFYYSSGDFYRAKPYNVNWTCTDSKNRGISKWKIEWESSTGKKGTVTGTSGSDYTFPAYTFPAGNITFHFSVKSGGDGIWSNVITTSKIITAIDSKPTVKATEPINGTQTYRAKATTIEWDYSDTADVAQSAYQVDWTCGGKSGTTGRVGNANKFATFQPYSFPNGEITYYITVWNKDGIQSQKAGPYTFNAINSNPSVKARSPVDSDEFNHYEPVTFKWDYSDTADVEQRAFLIEYTTGEKVGSVSGTTDKQYVFPKNTFSEGSVIYYITVWNKDGIQSQKAGPYVAICKMSIPTVMAKYPVDISVQKSKELTYSWDFEETATTGQREFVLEVTQNGKITRHTGTTETSVTVPAYAYESGIVTYKITVTNNDGKTATTGNITFTVVPSYPSIDLVYPNSVLIKGTEEQIFTWNFEETVETGQKQYWIELTHNGETVEYTEESANHYHIFEPNTLPNGSSTFIIKVQNKDGEYAQIGPFSLTVISETEAPDILSITNDAKPTITWDTYSQDGFEVVIYDVVENVIFESGFVVGNETRSYQITDVLKNGRYLFNLRIQNEYGYYTPYATKYMEINAECVSEISDVTAYNTTEYAIAIETKYTGGTAYVIRRDPQTMKETNLGEYVGKFIDYTIPANRNMQYCIRLYDGGITDSEWIIGYVQIKEVLIRDTVIPEEYVLLDLTDEELFSIRHDDAREKTMLKVLGRTYGIMESSEWITSIRTFRAFTTNEQFKKLKELELSGEPVGYQAEDEYMLGNLEVNDDGKYMSGRMVSITITRIDDGGD